MLLDRLLSELNETEITMFETQQSSRSVDARIPDETEVKSFGFIPIEFDSQEEQADFARHLVLHRGII